MSKFRVGQRVRIARNNGVPLLNRLIGGEGTISSISHGEFDDGHEILLREYFGIIFHHGDLEPATDCYDKAEWSECIWRPEHLRVGA